MASARQLTAASRVVGEQVIELVPLQFRKATFPLFLALGLALGVAIMLWAQTSGSGSGILGAAVGGGVIGGAFALGVMPRSLALSSRGLTLLGSSIWIPTPNRVLGSVAPESVSLEGGFLNRVVRIAGDKHIVSRVHVARLEQVLASARG